MVATDQASISKDEVNLYDRQIRLWGLDGQTRLREARILMLGFGSIAVEIVKNLVLAGAGALTLQSSENVSATDLGTNFFLRADDIGHNAAEASRIRVQRLNPRVAVVTEQRPVSELSDDFFSEFDVVIATQITEWSTLVRINNITHAKGHAFYYGSLHGWAGYVFADLVDHEFKMERERGNVRTAVGPKSRTQTVLSVEDVEKNEQITIRETYHTLEQAVAAAGELGPRLRPRQRAKVSPYLPALLAAWETGDSVSAADIERKADTLGLPRSIVNPRFVQDYLSTAGVEVSAVGAVIGGIMSQDAINYLTRRRYPIQNLVVYDAKRGLAPMYCLG